MDRSLAEQARALLGSARALLAELVEEGVQEIPAFEETQGEIEARRTALEPTGAPSAAGPPDEDPATPLLTTQPALLDTHPWGPNPSLQEVRDTLGECQRCGLCQKRTHIVFGDGSPEADLMFVGEGPGETEDHRGLPFVGRAGELLTQMIEKGLRIPRSEVYICNVVKCRPPGNRTPLADEVAACSPFLDGQIAAVEPKVIVALGRPAASLLLGRNVSITKIRGTWHEYRGTPLMPTFHPAFVLRRYTHEIRSLVWDDLKAALARARQAEGG